MKQSKGITLIALVITIIILLILAGISMNLLIGPNGIINRAKDSSEVTKRASVVEKVELILGDYSVEKYTGTKTLEEYLNEQKEKGTIDEVTNNGDGSFTIEVDGYEVTIREEDLSIIEVVKAGGIRPKFDVILTKTDGSTISTSEEETLTKKAMTINITNIAEFGENYTIEVKGPKGTILTKENNVTAGVTGQASFFITEGGNYTITVTGTKEGITKKTTKIENIKIAMPEIEESAMFSKEYGVIDIIWIDRDNKKIDQPISPADYLGGLIPIQYEGTEEVQVKDPKEENTWYSYIAQTGNKDEKTSRWANARTQDSNAYFVWIPRYAYKITYFNSEENAKKYREDKSSTEGIIGYSNIDGMVDVVNGTPQLVKDSKPTNVTGKVQTKGYEDYIPHPAFEFGEEKPGIWMGKYESSGNKLQAINKGVVDILPNKEGLTDIEVKNIVIACQKVKENYQLNCDSHMMKNIEWGAVAYLAESKYGRNGENVSINSSNSITGGGDYKANVLQSTTGNIYGIYDMEGTNFEYTSCVRLIKNVQYYDFSEMDQKYYELCGTYRQNLRIKGNAIYETSMAEDRCWNGLFCMWTQSGTAQETVMVRSTFRTELKGESLFIFRRQSGVRHALVGFRVVLSP